MKLGPILFIVLILCCASCSTALQTTPIALQYKQSSKRYFVQNHGYDRRRIDMQIAQELKKRHLTVSSGFANERPADFDVLVLYEDRWQWDMSNYLIHMRIDFRDPKTNALLATGSSYQTSVARESIDVIVEKIISEIFK